MYKNIYSDDHTMFIIDEVFRVKGIGLVVSGRVDSGSINVNGKNITLLKKKNDENDEDFNTRILKGNCLGG